MRRPDLLAKDAAGDNPHCVICSKSTRHMEGALFCSPGCEHKAMTLKHGTVAERFAAEAQRVDPFYLQTRIVDGGLWPGANHSTKINRKREEWRRSF